jgi:aminopeptidase-like protein
VDATGFCGMTTPAGQARSMMQILADLTPLNRVCCSSDYDRTVDYLCEVLPFRVLEYKATDEHNGWVIPPKWDVIRAEIRRGDRVVFDGRSHALGVIALSAPFAGSLDRDELRAHLHVDHRYDDALTFHFRQQFRSWARDWGFCVPRTLYDALEAGVYDVVIETTEAPGILKVLELEHAGNRPETIVLGANLDHPGVANDGLAGVVVGIELMRRLAGTRTAYSYRLVLVQGIIGSEYYLARTARRTPQLATSALFLEMLGSRTPLRLQRSRHGGSDFEEAVSQVARGRVAGFVDAGFGSALINDEYIWEAYGIPTASLSRFPYPEYHSSHDNLAAIDEQCLTEAVETLVGAVSLADASPLIRRRFEGTVCLSNPRYDLYVDPGQIAVGDIPSERRLKLRQLMDLIPTLDSRTSIRQVALKVDLPYDEVLNYLRRWETVGLISLD